MLVLGLLMPLALLLVVGLVRPHTEGWRDAGLLAGVLVGLGLVAVTEAASALGAVTLPVLGAAWGVVCLGALAGIAWRPPGRSERPPMTRELVALVAVVAALLALVLGLGVAVAPNTYDAMVYHLPRVAHWAQAGSIDHYPTSCARQLYSNPFAELVILNSYVLTGRGDLLANAVQGTALVGAAVAASAIARRTGLGFVGQAWSALFVVTLPQAVVQGQTSQNDLVVAAALMAAGVFGLDVAGGRTGAVQVVGWGGSLGLALLTKGTALLFAPFIVVAPVVALCVARGRRAAAPLVVAGIVAFAPNLGHWTRNLRTFGDPLLPPGEDRRFQMESHGPAALLSNAVRITASHFEPPSTRVALAFERFVRGAHELVGVDPDDPRTTYPGEPFVVRRLLVHEDQVVNPCHMLLALVAAGIVLRRAEHRAVRPVVAATGLAMLSVTLFLKWQPWLCRLTLPIAVGVAPIAAAVIEAHLTGRARSLLTAAAVLLTVHALTIFKGHELLPHPSRPWPLTLPREEQYFLNDHGGFPPPLELAARWLREREVRRIGLVGLGNDPEYQLWRLLGPEVRIEHLSPWPEEAAPHLRGAAERLTDGYAVSLEQSKVRGLRALGWREVFVAGHVTIWQP